LTTIKPSAQAFLSKETELHVLFNNAGVMTPPQGSHTVQGYEQCLGINNIGPFLFTKLLTPILISTAKSASPNTVRVIWVSSSGAEYIGVKSAGVPIDNLDYHKDEPATYKYGVSKAGNYLHSCEFAKRYKAEGVISVSLNPGNLVSELANNQPGAFQWMKRHLADYPTVNGAYTELFAGLSAEVTIERTGDWGK
jgi:retinol dehydrogenase 12